MARVASNNNRNISLPTATPFMDRLSHAVIKETSKSLRHYIDVKRRENAFVLNPNSSALDSSPIRARLIYGTAKEYPPLYGSCHSDNDIKVYLRNFQQQQRQTYSTSNSAEKQMCREELNYHMRTNKSPSKENRKFAELRLRPSVRASSVCSVTSAREFQRGAPKSAFKLSRHEQNQLVDDTANILATVIKTRRSIYETHVLSQQSPHTYDSRNANPSPRQADEQSNEHPVLPSLTHPSADSRYLTNNQQPIKQKRTTKNALEKSVSIMQKAKPITKGLLCEYKVSVTTGNCNGASTDAPIRIKFYGTNGYTPFLDLVDSETHRIPFSKNKTDVFTIQTYYVGQLAGITIGHDRKDIRSSWFLNKLSIFDPIRDITSDIPCNAWLSSKSTDQKTMRDFPVVSMISHKKHINSDEHREEIRNQSDSSTQSTEDTKTPDTTNRSPNNQIPDHKRTRKYRKQHRVSIGSTKVVKRPTSLTAITNHLSQPPPLRTVESHFNRDEFPSPSQALARRNRSPFISSASSSDTEIEDHIVNHRRPTPSPTFDQSREHSFSDHSTSPPTTGDTVKRHSIDHNRPSPRLEKYNSPIPASPKQPIKSKEETNDDDTFNFFE